MSSMLRRMNRQSTKLAAGDVHVLSIVKARANKFEERLEQSVAETETDLRRELAQLRDDLRREIEAVRERIAKSDAELMIEIATVNADARDRSDEIRSLVLATFSWRVVAAWRWLLARLAAWGRQ